MAGTIARALKQTKPFASREEEVLLAVQHAAARLIEPWAQFLKTTSRLTVAQYNVLRILRGAHPSRLACSDIADRMVARDPDVTRLIDRLADRELVDRARHEKDRRVVEVGITAKGLAMLRELDPSVQQFPRVMLGHMGKARLEQLLDLLEAVVAEPATFPPNRVYRSGLRRSLNYRSGLRRSLKKA